MECNHCGATIPDDSIFCEVCGQKLGGRKQNANRCHGHSTGRKRLAWVVGIVGLLIAAGVAAAVLFLHRPTEEVNFSEMDELLFLVYNEEGKMGLIDTNGTFVVQPLYDYIYSFSEEGIALVEQNGKKGYVDKTGTIIVSPCYDEAFDFSEGMAQVTSDGKEGFIDKTGKMVVPFQYDWAGSFHDGMAKVWIGDKVGYIDSNGTEMIHPQYDIASNFSEGIARVKQNNKWGCINKRGDTVVSPRYDTIYNFLLGMAPAKLDGKWGIIDTCDNVVMPFQIETKERILWNAKKYMACISYDDKKCTNYIYVNRSKKTIYDVKYFWKNRKYNDASSRVSLVDFEIW